MPCTRFYVGPTAAPIGQAKKNRLLGLLEQRWENMRGHNPFLIIITPKDNTQAFKKAENKHSKNQEIGSEGHFSALYVIIEVSPPPTWAYPLHPTPPYIQPLPPPSPVQTPTNTLARFHILHWIRKSCGIHIPSIVQSYRHCSPCLQIRSRGGGGGKKN